MDTIIPSTDQIRAQLSALSLAQVERLAEASGVPQSTLIKIRYGQTANPGIETVRLFLPHLSELIGQPGAPAVEQKAA